MAYENYQACIDACNQCAVECDNCASACLRESEIKMLARCISLDQDCARVCRLASTFMSSNSDFARDVCRLCVEICRACGEECSQHDMDHCQRCATACEHCADECERMTMAGVV